MSSNRRHFENPFDDYSAGSLTGFISNGKLNADTTIDQQINARWEKTMQKLQNLDFNDYSVYTGTSGIALLKLLKSSTDRLNLQEAKQLLSLNKLRNRRQSFLCGDSGPLAIGAILSYKLHEHSEMNLLLEKLIAMSDAAVDCNSDLPNEYLYGRAGYLFALLYVNKHIQPAPVSKSLIREVIEAIINCGKSEARSGKFKCPLMYQWHDSYYLGAAHGISGIIYLLLQAKEYLTESELYSLIKPTIDYLATLKYPSGNYPSSLGSQNDKYMQWCHGAPGFVYLFTTAYKVFGDPNYLQLAIDAGDVVWKRGLIRKGYSICHGVAGNGYCFLELYQTTEEERYLHRALKFAEWCLVYTKTHEEYSPDRLLSLFEGIAGQMYFLLDLQKPLEAKFPGFTL